MPISGLATEPNRRAILADMSCDSDGMINRFVVNHSLNRSLPVHQLDSHKPYYLGIFLVGAYQEIMGGVHNLFGDTNVVHIEVDSTGKLNFVDASEGDTIREVLRYTRFNPDRLLSNIEKIILEEVASGALGEEEGNWIRNRYWEAIEGYTYLCRRHPSTPPTQCWIQRLRLSQCSQFSTCSETTH